MRLSPHPVTLRQLQYVVAVADRRSFRRAAEDCHVSQPSLSAQLAQAEDALGVRLFERDRRGVLPTAAGAALVERARQLLLAADELVTAARRLAEPFSGTLRLGVIPTIAPYLLPELAPVLRARYPKLAVEWLEDRTAALVERLLAGGIDGAILALEAELGDVERLVLGTDPFVLAAPPGHALARSARPVSARELDGERVLLLDDGHCFREQALAVCAKSGAEELGFRATSLSTLTQMAAAGAGVTLLPAMAVPLENRGGALRIRPFVPKAPARTVALVWRRRSALEATLRPVGETLRDAYRSFAAKGWRGGSSAP